jgi:hypothetical protein
MRVPSPESVVIAPRAGAFRRWLRSDMRVLRWIFLEIYVLIVAGLFATFLPDTRETFIIATVVGLIVSQALMIFGTGTIAVCRPIRRRRLVLPVLGASFMLTVLVAGFSVAMAELLYLDRYDFLTPAMFFGFLAASWIGWGVLLWNHVRERPKFQALSRLTRTIFAGSLAELLATVPAHVIVSRRPGCLVGLATMMGIAAGLSVMLASFGPAIFLLFLRPRHRAELGADGHPHCPACGYDLFATPDRCPECGLAITPALV